MNELLEALKGIVQCCDGNDPTHEQIYHIANDVIKKHDTKQLIIGDVSGSYSVNDMDDAYDKGFKDAMLKYRE